MKKLTMNEKEGSKDKVKGKLGNFFLFTFSLMLFALCGYTLYYALVSNYLKGNVSFLTKSAVFSTACVLGAISLMNIYVTRVSNRINYWYSTILKGEDIVEKYEKGCSYCGEKGKRLICGSCDSILWYKIDGWHDKVCFFAAHRRNLVNGVLLTALLVTPLTFLYQQIDKKLEAYNTYEQKSLEAREALNRARGLLVSLENLDFAYQAEPSKLLQKRIELMGEFQQAYTKTSWMAPQVIGYFSWDHHEQGFLDKIKGNFFNKQDSLFDLDTTWKYMNTKWVNAEGKTVDFFKILDDDFQRYVRASDDYYHAAFGHTSNISNLNTLKENRCKAAKIFYKKGQLAGCLLFHISFDNNRTDVSNNKDLDFVGCSCYFKDFKDVWKDTMDRIKINSFEEAIIGKKDSTGLFKCQYVQPNSQPKPSLPNSKADNRKAKMARYEVIAGHFKLSQGADNRMVELKDIGYSPSKQWDASKAMYKVIALKTNEALKAYTSKHILYYEHGIEAFVMDRKRLQQSPENGFAYHYH